MRGYFPVWCEIPTCEHRAELGPFCRRHAEQINALVRKNGWAD